MSDKAKIIRIINDTLKAHSLEKFGVDSNADINVHQLIWIQEDKNPIARVLKDRSPQVCDGDILYRFMKSDYAIGALQEKAFRMYNLESQSLNDYAEFTEFYKRVGLLGYLMPEEYCRKMCSTKKNMTEIRRHNENPIYCDIGRPNKSPQSDRVRNLGHILCFTRNLEDRFWLEYADSDDGVCFEIQVLTNSSFGPSQNERIGFNRVSYDSGYDFDFISEINFRLRQYCMKEVMINGLFRFSFFYKRDRYSWEKETRLLIYNPNQLERFDDSYIKYPIHVPNGSIPYTIRIRKVHIGRNVPKDKVSQITDLANAIDSSITVEIRK